MLMGVPLKKKNQLCKPGISIIHWTLVTLSQPPRWKLSTQTHHHKNNGPYSSIVCAVSVFFYHSCIGEIHRKSDKSLFQPPLLQFYFLHHLINLTKMIRNVFSLSQEIHCYIQIHSDHQVRFFCSKKYFKIIA